MRPEKSPKSQSKVAPGDPNRCLKNSIMKAVQIKSHGDPLDVLEVVDVPEPKAPGVNEALIGIELAALTKYDLLSISRALGEGPALPTIVGTEGPLHWSRYFLREACSSPTLRRVANRIRLMRCN